MLERCAQTGQMRDMQAERDRYEQRTREICLAARRARQNEITRICAQHELESDEFETAEQKAARYL